MELYVSVYISSPKQHVCVPPSIQPLASEERVMHLKGGEHEREGCHATLSGKGRGCHAVRTISKLQSISRVDRSARSVPIFIERNWSKFPPWFLFQRFLILHDVQY